MYQPWAQLMAMGLKTVETRRFRLSHRGDLAICAGRARVICLERILAKPEFAALSGVKLEWGKVLCVVELYDCLPTTRYNPGAERPFGNYVFGRQAWLTRNLRTLPEPVPVRGSCGIFFLSAETQARVEAQLKTMNNDHTKTNPVTTDDGLADAAQQPQS